jgi:hypothetical protein
MAPVVLLRWSAWGLLVVVAALLGWLNYRATDDVQAVAAGLLLAGFGFSYWRPRWAWLFVLVLWLAIPLSAIYAAQYNFDTTFSRPHPLYETLVALVPTAIGALLGAGARWTLGQART